MPSIGRVLQVSSRRGCGWGPNHALGGGWHASRLTDEQLDEAIELNVDDAHRRTLVALGRHGVSDLGWGDPMRWVTDMSS